ncbi:MAG TPA: helix-turn-helix domain-containing protein, partial [Ferruginibacter sp.]|nr:helix-turn-helix domain-containing protein [Ferruginibacter sp.]
DDLHIQPYQLSAFINQVMGVHYTDYMNKFRISHCELLMRTDPMARQNLKELAYKCGFNNRNSFATAFKKYTGYRPSDYVKLL